MGRRPASFRETLSFGGRVSPAVGLLLAGIFSASILAALLPAVRFAAALVPEALAAGQVWRLGTWAFVEVDPINLVFALLVLFWLGRDLSFAWGERRFVAMYLGLAAGASAITAAVAWLVPALASSGHLGSWPVIAALTVAWGMLYPDRQILFFMLLPMTGRVLVWVTVGGTLLYAVFARSLGAFVPHFAAEGLAALYVSGARPGRLLRGLRFRPFDRLRRVRDRKKFKVIEVERDPDRDRPRWLN